MLTIICEKCGKLSYAPIVQRISNKSGEYKYRVFRHPHTKQKTGEKIVKRCYIPLRAGSNSP